MKCTSAAESNGSRKTLKDDKSNFDVSVFPKGSVVNFCIRFQRNHSLKITGKQYSNRGEICFVFVHSYHTSSLQFNPLKHANSPERTTTHDST